MLRQKFNLCPSIVKNKLFKSYFSNVYMCALWVNHRKTVFQHINKEPLWGNPPTRISNMKSACYLSLVGQDAPTCFSQLITLMKSNVFSNVLSNISYRWYVTIWSTPYYLINTCVLLRYTRCPWLPTCRTVESISI